MPRTLPSTQRTSQLRPGILLLALGLLLPQAGRAQLFQSLNLEKFKDGSYVLENDHTVRHLAQIKLLDDAKLVVKKEHGKNLLIWPGEVYSVSLDGKKYVKVEDFYTKGGLGRSYVEIGFAEQLDSGQVVLLRYDYNVGSAVPVGAANGLTLYRDGAMSAYLLRGATESGVTVAQAAVYSKGGKQFLEALRSYFAGRPDLLQLLNDKRITTENLPAAIHALNHNLSFTPQTE